MKPKLFISYSRREVAFVNQMVDDLEDRDFQVWLDYSSLIPGTQWAAQIEKGITTSEVIILVVSKASMASEYVEYEWQRVLARDKRIILAIFEAVELPKELEAFEWVDFRGSYQAALQELIRQVEQPETEDHPAPETGFKVPSMVWFTAALALIVAIMSLGAIWTLFIPYLLGPLPLRIFRRDFNYNQVQASIVALPFALLLSAFFVEDDLIFELLLLLTGLSIPFSGALFLALRSKPMQRWGKPIATRPIFANLYKPDNPKPRPVSFYIDFAPEDQIAPQDLQTALTRYGHPQAEAIEQAEAVFVLVSRYNTSTEADPQQQVVFPVILQTVEDIHQKLSKVQWIDFRNGFRNLEALAQLLPEPIKLLKALGIRPMGEQMVMPPAVQYLMYFILALAIFTVGSFLPYVIQFLPEIQAYSDADFQIIILVVNLALFVGLSVWMTRALVGRHGRLSSLRNQGLAMIGLGLLIAWQFDIAASIEDLLGIFENVDDFRGFSSFFPILIYMLGNFGMLFWVIIKRTDFRRWFPARVKQ